MNQLIALGLALVAAYVIWKYVRAVYRQQHPVQRTYKVTCACGWQGQTSRLPMRCPECRQLIGAGMPR